jgi:hypothetical protein
MIAASIVLICLPAIAVIAYGVARKVKRANQRRKNRIIRLSKKRRKAA